jgi:integrase
MPLKLVPRKGSPYWYLRGSVRGISVFESTGVGLDNRPAAEDALAVRHAELVRRSILGDPATRTFAEAALSYLEAGGERTHLAPIIKHFGNRKLAQIGQAEIDEAARKLKPKSSSPSTLNRHIYTPIAAVLHHAARKKWCDKPVIARPQEPKGRIRYITPDEADRLLLAASPHLRPLVVFLLGTGARLSEALYLDWRQVDLNRRQVTFLDTKNGDPRSVPLHPRVVAALSALAHREGAVFRRPAKKGDKNPLAKPYSERLGGGGQVKTAWAGMLRRSGIKDFTPHDCRHTWATWHYAANRDLAALMQLGGWKSPEMVLRYAHANVGHLTASIDAMWDGKTTQDVQSENADQASA